MKFLLPIFISLLMCINHGLLSAQNLSGKWTGSASDGSYVELVLVKCGEQYVGYSYDRGIGFCKANFAGVYDTATEKLKGKGMGFIEKTFGHGQARYNLHYFNRGGSEILKGTASPKSVAAKIGSFGLPVFLTLTKNSFAVDTTSFIRESLALVPLPKLDTGNALAVVQSRQTNTSAEEILLNTRNSRVTDTIQTIVTSEQKVLIKLFDNGVEDGDSVSIFHDNKIIAAHQLVSSQPYTIELMLSANDPDHVITLVAHNLGSIPPNTAMLIIEAGQNRYTLNASSSLTRNALIRIKYQE